MVHKDVLRRDALAYGVFLHHVDLVVAAVRVVAGHEQLRRRAFFIKLHRLRESVAQRAARFTAGNAGAEHEYAVDALKLAELVLGKQSAFCAELHVKAKRDRRDGSDDDDY